MIEQVWPDRTGFVAVPEKPRTCRVCGLDIGMVALETKKGPVHPACSYQVAEEDWPAIKFFDVMDELDEILKKANG